MRDSCSVGKLVAVALGLALAFPARADEPSASADSPPPAEPTRPAVLVRVASSPEEVGRLALLLEELLGRLKVPVVIQAEAEVDPVGGPRGRSLALVSIDLSPPDRALCTVEDGQGRVRMERREVVGTASRAILLDDVAHLVQASVESLLAEHTDSLAAPQPGPRPTSPPKAPAMADRPQPTPPSRAKNTPPAIRQVLPVRGRPLSTTEQHGRPDWGLDVAAMLGFHGVAETAPMVVGAAAATHAGYRRGNLHPGGWLSLEYRLPFDIDQSSLPPSAQVLAPRVLFAMDFYFRRPWSLGAAIGGGVDRFQIEYGFEAIGQPPRRLSVTRVVPVLATFSVVRLGIARNVHLLSLWGIEVDLEHPDLEIRHDRRRAARPWPVRPALMLGMAFTPLGVEAFE